VLVGKQMEKQPLVPHSSHGEEPADGESSGQLQALYHDRRALTELSRNLAPSDVGGGGFWHSPRI